MSSGHHCICNSRAQGTAPGWICKLRSYQSMWGLWGHGDCHSLPRRGERKEKAQLDQRKVSIQSELKGRGQQDLKNILQVREKPGEFQERSMFKEVGSDLLCQHYASLSKMRWVKCLLDLATCCGMLCGQKQVTESETEWEPRKERQEVWTILPDGTVVSAPAIDCSTASRLYKPMSLK